VATQIVRMQQRRDTTERWELINPVLRAGEMGYDTDLDRFKMGDGSSAWVDLEFLNVTLAQVDAITDALVPGLVIESLAADNTPAAAAAAAVSTEIATRNLQEVTKVYPTDDAQFTIAGAGDKRRWWLEVGLDGGPTLYALQKMLAALLPSIETTAQDAAGVADFNANLNGLLFAVVDQNMRRTWVEAGLDGWPTQRVIDYLQSRLGVTVGGIRRYEPYYSPHVSGYDPRLAAYGANQTQMRGWLNKVAGAIEGNRTGHLAFVGTSRVYGAEGSGSNYPKWSNAFPGLVRKALDTLVGASGGTGWAMTWDELWTYPAGDPRFTWGSAVTNAATYGDTSTPGYGPHGLCGAVITNGANGWLQFAPTVTTISGFRFVIALPSGNAGLATVKVDGASVGTISLAPDGSGGASLTRDAGTPAGMAAYTITGLTPGTHTIRIDGVTAGQCIVTMVEGTTGVGIKVSSFARSSSSHLQWNRDDGVGRYGMAQSVDFPKADLYVMGDFTNDRAADQATMEARFRVYIERILTAGGAILLMPLSKPDFVSLGVAPADVPTWNALWDTHVGTLYKLRDEYDLGPVLDVNDAIGTFAVAEQQDYFADTIHEGQMAHRRLQRMLAPLITP
jgi:hypothetical protein